MGHAVLHSTDNGKIAPPPPHPVITIPIMCLPISCAGHVAIPSGRASA